MARKQKVVVDVPVELVKLNEAQKARLKKMFQTEIARVVPGQESESAFAVSLQNTKPKPPSVEALSAKSPAARGARKTAGGGSRKGGR